MTESDLLLKNRLLELAHRAFSRECYIFSEFLTIAEQNILSGITFDKTSASFTLQGGYDTAERKIACFGDEQICGYSEAPPIVCIRISPVSQKFADELTHRDFLGALMALGFRRNVLGDMIISENSAYLLCLKSVSKYIIEQFHKVKHTTIRCAATEVPKLITVLPEPVQVNIASERLDAAIASVYKLSRNESQKLFAEGKIFVDSKLTENVSFCPASGSVVSVRGFGRFIYEGIERETKKGRLRVSIRVF